MKLSVIISCYSAENIINDCLSALTNQTYSNIEIIVVDANSPDNTVLIIEENFPDVILIKQDRIGVGAALNIGLRQASGDIIVIDFNTDEVADTRWAEYLIDAHKKWGKHTIISPARRRPDGKVGAYGLNFRFNGSVYQIGYGQKYNPSRPTEICDATGINTFHRSLLKEIGFIDEFYEFYGADVDFSLRGRAAGYSIRTEPKAYTTHQRSTSKEINHKKYYERMNYGIMRSALIHGSKKVAILSIGYYSLYQPGITIIRGLINIITQKRADEAYDEFIGRMLGVKRYIMNLPRDLKVRMRIPKKLIQ